MLNISRLFKIATHATRVRHDICRNGPKHTTDATPPYRVSHVVQGGKMNMKRSSAKRLVSVKEAIMRLLIVSPGKWFSSRAITAHLYAELGRNIKPTSYLLRLVKSGHVLRAYKPRHLINSKNGQKEFIYRWSGRPYRDKIEAIKRTPYDDLPPTDRAILMRCLSAHYPGLPGPYQRMML